MDLLDTDTASQILQSVASTSIGAGDSSSQARSTPISNNFAILVCLMMMCLMCLDWFPCVSSTPLQRAFAVVRSGSSRYRFAS